jgi:hypothetical protein
MKKNILLAALCLLAWAAPLLAAQPTEIITYQGRLKDNSLPANGNYAFAFDLCDAAATDCYPAPELSQGFQVTNGLFKSTFTLPSVNLFSQPWYLRVSVGGIPLLPMERLTFVPYSVFASTAANSLSSVRLSGDTMTGQLTLAGSTLTVTGNAFSVGGSTLAVRNGNVGIGTAAPYPYSKLHVVTGGTPNLENITLESPASNVGFALKFMQPEMGWAVGQNIGNYADGRFQVMDLNASEARLTLLRSGNMGVGSTEPPYLLSVSSGAGEAGNIVVISTGASEMIRMTGGGEIFAAKFIGDGSGITGVTGATGTDPNALPKAGGMLTGNLLVHDSTLSVTGGEISISSFSQPGSAEVAILTDMAGGHIRTQNGHLLHFGVNGADTMVLSGGGLGVGYPGPLYQLHVGGAGAFTGQVIAGGTLTVQGSAFSVGGSTLAVKNGNVGVGTTDPARPLTVTGPSESLGPVIDINATSTVQYGRAVRALAAGMAAGDDLYFQAGRSDAGLDSGYFGYHHVADGAPGNFMTIGLVGRDYVLNVTGAGRVGVGVANPEGALDVAGIQEIPIAIFRSTGAATVALRSDDTAPQKLSLGFNSWSASQAGLRHMSDLNSEANGDVTIYTTNAGASSGIERLRITAAGRLGVNYNSPEARLDVLAEGGAPADMAQIWRDSTGVIVSSVSATGYLQAVKFVGDGSGLTGVAAVTGVDATKLPLAGGAMQGTLDMGGNYLSGVSTITMYGGSIAIVPPGTGGSNGGYGVSIGSNTYNNYSGGVGVGKEAGGNHTYGVGVGAAAGGNNNYGVGVGSNASGNYLSGVGVGRDAYGNSTLGVGVGAGANANYNYGVGVGFNANANFDSGVGVGASAGGNSNNGVGVGAAAASNSDFGVGLGANSNFNRDYGLGLGASASGNRNYAAGVGAFSQNNKGYGSALGAYSYASSSATALGAQARANAELSLALGYGTVNDSTGTASFGNYALYSSSSVGIGGPAQQARLDVQAVTGMMAQVWRDPAGVIVSSVNPAGYLQAVKFIGDGSGLTNVAAATGVDSSKLSKAGDTMTGPLQINVNGAPVAFQVGVSTFVVKDGLVGINKSGPTEALDIGSGNIRLPSGQSVMWGGASDAISADGTGMAVSQNAATRFWIGSTGGYTTVGAGDVFGVNLDTNSALHVVSKGLSTGDGRVAVFGDLRSNGSAAGQYMASGNFEATVDGADNAELVAGLRAVIRRENSSGGLVNNAYGLMIDNLQNNAGTIGKTFGIYIGDQTSGTQTDPAYSLYASDPNTRNYFAGPVGIGTDNPAYTLDVTGNLNSSSGYCIAGNCISSWNSAGSWAKNGLVLSPASPADNVLIQSTLTVAGNAFSVDGFTLLVKGGMVGIGASSPGYALDVSGTIRAATPAGSNGRIILGDGDVAHGMTGLNITSDTFGHITANSPNGGLHVGGFSSSPSETGLQLLGVIGNENPAAGVPAVRISGARRNGAASQALGSNDTLLDVANNSGTGLLTVRGSGRVGIGATSPGAQLEVRDVTAAGSYLMAVGTGPAGAFFTISTAAVVGVGYGNPSTQTVLHAQAIATNVTGGEDVMAGLIGSARALGTGAEDVAVGGDFKADADGNQNLGYLAGLHAAVERTSGGAGTIDTAVGLYIEQLRNSAGPGGVNNTYGIYIATQTSGAQTNLPYAIYSVDSGARAYFAGKLGIGAGKEAPGQSLDVAGNIWTTGNIGIGDTPSGGDLHIRKIVPAGTVQLNVENASNLAGADAEVLVQVGGANANDPMLDFSVGGVMDWSVGIDNSDADKFKISESGGVGTNDRLTIGRGGHVGIGTAAPRFALEVSSAVGSSDLILAVSTGTDVVFGVKGNGETYSAKFIGDGSGLTNVSGSDSSKLPLSGGTLAGALIINSLANPLMTPGMIITSSGSLQSSGTGHGGVAGNARGQGAVDLQTYRNAAVQVASGANSVIAGGMLNTSSNNGTAVGGGSGNSATGIYTVVPGGYNNSAGGQYAAVGGGNGNAAGFDYAVVGGGSGNSANWAATVAGGQNNSAGVSWSVVGGGRLNAANGMFGAILGGDQNQVQWEFGTVGGGQYNVVSGSQSFIGGGAYNTVAGTSSVVAGGEHNSASGLWGTVGGGVYNDAKDAAFVGGGEHNTAHGADSAVLGGRYNSAGYMSSVGGGNGNRVDGYYSFVGSGWQNDIDGNFSAVGGGYYNVVSGSQSVIGGGAYNTVTGTSAVVAGGELNTASGIHAGVLGGNFNRAAGAWAAVAGGVRNEASNNYSYVGGGVNNKAMGQYSLIGGGNDNNVYNGGFANAIVGGDANVIMSNNYYSFIGGGSGNYINPGGWDNAVLGGFQNYIYDYSQYSAIHSGRSNRIWNQAFASAVAGGSDNQIFGSSSTIAGGHNNVIVSTGAFIGGGGSNRASAEYTAIAGGTNNTASYYAASVGGGYYNTAGSYYSAIGGGMANEATGHTSSVSGGRGNAASGQFSAVSGGTYNGATGDQSFVGAGEANLSTAPYSTVGGGLSNTSSGTYSGVFSGHRNEAYAVGSVIAGGEGNYAGGQYSFVGSGQSNQAPGNYSAIGGGASNSTDFGQYSFIGAGMNNTVNSLKSVIGGGDNNQIVSAGTYSGIFSGQDNLVAAGINAFIGGGYTNVAQADFTTVSGGVFNYASAYGATVAGGANAAASGQYSMVAGGNENSAVGDYSFAAGRKSSSTAAGTFTWSDSTATGPLINNVPQQVMFKASGGFWVSTGTIYTDPGLFVRPDNRVAVGMVTTPTTPARLQVNGDLGLGNGTDTGNAPVVVWLRNSMASAVPEGSIVVLSAGNAFATTTTAGATNVIGVVYEPGGIAATTGVGRVAIAGVARARCNGTAALGNHVITSLTAGEAGSTPTPGAIGSTIGIWMEACTSPALGRVLLR